MMTRAPGLSVRTTGGQIVKGRATKAARGIALRSLKPRSAAGGGSRLIRVREWVMSGHGGRGEGKSLLFN